MQRSRLLASKSQLEVQRACVTAGHPLGAEVGAAILRRGGNAVDAAVGTAFAMAVVEPFMSGLAGGGSMLIHQPRSASSITLDFNVEAPRRAHARMYALATGRGQDLFPWRRVAGDANVHGHRAVAVPGSVAGLALALERWGTWDLRDVVAPAARLARRGFPTDWYLAGVTAAYAEELAAFPEAARTYLRGGRWPPRPAHLAAADRVRYPALARTIELIGKEGPDVFYRGELAEAIDAEMRRGDGVLDRADLAAYRVRVAEPLVGTYRGVTLLGMPGATGCLTALAALNVLECFDGGRDPASARTVHLRAEALRLAFGDRLRWLGDAAVVGGGGGGGGGGGAAPPSGARRGARWPGSRTRGRWPPRCARTAGERGPPAWTRGRSSAGGGTPGDARRCLAARRPTSARPRCARSTATGRWSRSPTPR